MGSSCGCCYKSQRVCSSAPHSRLRSAPSSFNPPPSLPPFSSPAARRAFLAVRPFLLITSPPRGARSVSPLVRVVSVL